jgi:Xaa-Pro aminopeptidase
MDHTSSYRPVSIASTNPANGTFTEPQRDLYSAVLTAQKALVAKCHAGSGMSLQDLHRESVELLRRELNQLGFHMKAGDLERVLYPHYLSHSIGIGAFFLFSWREGKEPQFFFYWFSCVREKAD